MRVGLGIFGIIWGTQTENFRATGFFEFLLCFTFNSKTFKHSSKRNIELVRRSFVFRVRGKDGTCWAKRWAHFYDDRLG